MGNRSHRRTCGEEALSCQDGNGKDCVDSMGADNEGVDEGSLLPVDAPDALGNCSMVSFICIGPNNNA